MMQPASKKKRVTSWEELIEILTTPARLPKFPELMPSGNWKAWSANPTPSCASSTTVEQPKTVPLRIRRLISRERKYCRPLQFKPLPNGHIRLLDLQDARLLDEVLVGFKLVTVSLSTAPQYEAISYCWGSTALCTGILISTRHHKNQVYRVTENLATCLHSLLVSDQPKADRPRYLWADQICINQEDIHERNAQVRLMADVYKTAARVIVWLGQEPTYVPEQLDLALLPDRHAIWKGRPILDWVLEWRILGRPWFFRLWVFQEAVFARRISILLGTELTTWDTLSDTSCSLVDFIDDVASGKFAYSLKVLDRLQFKMISQVMNTTERLATQAHIDLAYLISMLDKQDCQDPRDKIFSLVGFAADTLPVDFVDYNQPIDVINQDFTRRMIAQSGSLEAIPYMNAETPERSPSWVPLWHEHLWSRMKLYLEDTCASLDRKWKPSNSPATDGQLLVAGRVIDTIASKVHSFQYNVDQYYIENQFASVLQAPFHDTWSLRLQILESQNQLEQAAEVESEPEPQQETSKPACHSDSTLLELKSPVSTSSEPNSEALSVFFTEFFQTVFCGEVLLETDFDTLIQNSGEEALARLQDLMSRALHRNSSLFVLKSGRLGFVRNRVQALKGDESIVILHGHDIPCVLRRTDKNWLFVSEINVPGVMHGEGEHRYSHRIVALLTTSQRLTGRKTRQTRSCSYEAQSLTQFCA